MLPFGLVPQSAAASGPLVRSVRLLVVAQLNCDRHAFCHWSMLAARPSPGASLHALLRQFQRQGLRFPVADIWTPSCAASGAKTRNLKTQVQM